MPTLEEIQRSIESRLDELAHEMEQLRAARAALLDLGSSGRGRRSPRRRSPQPTRRSPQPARRPPQPARRAAAPQPAPPPSPAPPPVATPEPAIPSSEAPAPRRRGREPLSDERVIAMLNEFGGLSAIAIQKRAGAPEQQVRAVLRELESAGRIWRDGNSRASLWRIARGEQSD